VTNQQVDTKTRVVVQDKIEPYVWKIVAVVLCGPLMTQLDSTVVNVSLSTIQRDLHCTLSVVQWIISGYLLAQALMLPLNAWVVDRLGAKRVYLLSFSAFTLASVLCGAAKTIEQLIAARVLQGMAGGLLVPMTQLMIAKAAGRNMARVMGYTAVPILLAPLMGPPIAGAILKIASWQWLFYINLPVGFLALILAALLLPHDEPSSEKRAFDFLGFSLITPGLAALLFGFDHTSSSWGLGCLCSGVLFLGAFVWHSLRAQENALIDLRLFANNVFLTATITQFLNSGAALAGQMLVPLYIITGCDITPVKAAWILSGMGIGMMCSYPLMGILTHRFGCRNLVAGGVSLTILGTLPVFWMIHSGFSPWLMMASLIVRGAGQGAIGIPSISAGYAAIPTEKLAVATTASNIVQRLGGPVATTLTAIVLSFSSAGFPRPEPQVFLIPFLALVALQLLVLCSAWQLPTSVQHANR
jgi:EmrB/QacA subfamily drug resistance transporter